MAINAAGLDVAGANNPRWKGGLIAKTCEVCGAGYSVKPVQSKSRFCSLACVGKSQRGKSKVSPEALKMTQKKCEVCSAPYSVPTAHEKRYHCCSKSCSFKRRAQITKGEKNPNWTGGISRFPYPWNFNEISKSIIARDSGKCQNPNCTGHDSRLTTHHINYDKKDCRDENLICLCSSCNSKANFGREKWMAFYQALIADKIKIAADMYPFRFLAIKAKAKKNGGGWEQEDFS